MRIASPRTKQFSDGSIGYLHSMDSKLTLPAPTRRKPEPVVNSREIYERWAATSSAEDLVLLSKNLGIHHEHLLTMGCVRAHRADVFGFPMYDGKGYIIGIRMRAMDGKKWCNPGGHNGIFLPAIGVSQEIVIVEGPTDCAAALSIGLLPVGRFNCSGGIQMIQEYIKLNKVRRAVVVADVDSDREINGVVVNPGIQGAVALSEHLGIPSCIVTLPTKDMRAFVQKGGTRAMFDDIVKQLVWRKP